NYFKTSKVYWLENISEETAKKFSERQPKPKNSILLLDSCQPSVCKIVLSKADHIQRVELKNLNPAATETVGKILAKTDIKSVLLSNLNQLAAKNCIKHLAGSKVTSLWVDNLNMGNEAFVYTPTFQGYYLNMINVDVNTARWIASGFTGSTFHNLTLKNINAAATRCIVKQFSQCHAKRLDIDNLTVDAMKVVCDQLPNTKFVTIMLSNLSVASAKYLISKLPFMKECTLSSRSGLSSDVLALFGEYFGKNAKRNLVNN
ncbi:unnamed protein product, partial [marine sediment metagenome]